MKRKIIWPRILFLLVIFSIFSWSIYYTIAKHWNINDFKNKTSTSLKGYNINKEDIKDINQSIINIENEYKISNMLVAKIDDLNNPIIDYKSHENNKVSMSETKIFILEQLLKKLNDNKINIEDKIKIKKKIISEDSSFKDGDEASVKDLVSHIILNSSNTSANAIIEQVFEGIDKFSKLIYDSYKNIDYGAYFSLEDQDEEKIRVSNLYDVTTSYANIINNNSIHSNYFKDLFNKSTTKQYYDMNIENIQGGKIGNLDDAITYICHIKVNENTYVISLSITSKLNGAKINGNTIKGRKTIQDAINKICNDVLKLID